jgi:hypothetical protein
VCPEGVLHGLDLQDRVLKDQYLNAKGAKSANGAKLQEFFAAFALLA